MVPGMGTRKPEVLGQAMEVLATTTVATMVAETATTATLVGVALTIGVGDMEFVVRPAACALVPGLGRRSSLLEGTMITITALARLINSAMRSANSSVPCRMATSLAAMKKMT